MKNTFLVALLLCAGSVFAQETANVVKTNALGHFAGQYQFGYELALSGNISVQAQAGLITGSGSSTDMNTGVITEYKRMGFIVIPEVRYYLGGNACEGLYLAGSGRFRNVNNSENGELYYQRKTNGGALTLGAQWGNGDGFLFDLFCGPQIKNSVDLDGNGDELVIDEDVSEFLESMDWIHSVRLGFSIGYGF